MRANASVHKVHEITKVAVRWVTLHLPGCNVIHISPRNSFVSLTKTYYQRTWYNAQSLTTSPVECTREYPGRRTCCGQVAGSNHSNHAKDKTTRRRRQTSAYLKIYPVYIQGVSFSSFTFNALMLMQRNIQMNNIIFTVKFCIADFYFSE